MSKSKRTRLEFAVEFMEAIVAHAKEGGSFRALIYHRMGFGPEAYAPLYSAGGMFFSNHCPLPEPDESLEELRERKDAAYEERNRLVAVLASLFPSKMKRTNIPGWDPEWHWCVFIDLPAGQASWHVHESQLHLFEHVRVNHAVEWDGHTTEEKYERVASLAAGPLFARVDAS